MATKLLSPEALKTWLRGSKIVDRSGKPMLVWHGLKRTAPIDFEKDVIDKQVFFRPTFNKFSTTHRTEPGIYFATSEKTARRYGTPVAFYLRASNPIQHEGPLSKKPEGADAIYRTRAKSDDLADAWEIAVFDPSQIVLARGSQGAIVMESVYGIAEIPNLRLRKRLNHR